MPSSRIVTFCDVEIHAGQVEIVLWHRVGVVFQRGRGTHMTELINRPLGLLARQEPPKASIGNHEPSVERASALPEPLGDGRLAPIRERRSEVQEILSLVAEDSFGVSGPARGKRLAPPRSPHSSDTVILARRSLVMLPLVSLTFSNRNSKTRPSGISQYIAACEHPVQLFLSSGWSPPDWQM